MGQRDYPQHGEFHRLRPTSEKTDSERIGTFYHVASRIAEGWHNSLKSKALGAIRRSAKIAGPTHPTANGMTFLGWTTLHRLASTVLFDLQLRKSEHVLDLAGDVGESADRADVQRHHVIRKGFDGMKRLT